MRRGGGLLPRAGRRGDGDHQAGGQGKENREADRQGGAPAGIRAQIQVEVYFHSSLLRQGQASRCPVIRSSTRIGEVSGARMPLTGSMSVSSITNWPLIAACST